MSVSLGQPYSNDRYRAHLSKLPAVDEQQSPVGLPELLLELEAGQNVCALREREVERGDEESDACSAVGEAVGQVASGPGSGVKAREMPSLTLAIQRRPAFVQDATYFVREASSLLAYLRAQTSLDTYFVYPPTFPCTFHVVMLPLLSWKPEIPRAGLMLPHSSFPMFSCRTVTTLSCPWRTEPSGNVKRALTLSEEALNTVLMNLSLIQTENANAREK